VHPIPGPSQAFGIWCGVKVGVGLSRLKRGTTREKRYLGRIDLLKTTHLLEPAVLSHLPDLSLRILESTHPIEIITNSKGVSAVQFKPDVEISPGLFKVVIALGHLGGSG
jgi:hypothetical protein